MSRNNVEAIRAPCPNNFLFSFFPATALVERGVDAGVQVLAHIAPREQLEIELIHDQIGGETYDLHGIFCQGHTVEKATASDGVLAG